MRDRIREIIEKLGLKNSELGKVIGMNPQAFSNFLQGRTKDLSSSAINELKLKFNVDPLWLLTGEGEMFLSRREVVRDSRTNDAFEFARKVIQNQNVRPIVERLLALDKKSLEKIQAYLDGMEGK